LTESASSDPRRDVLGRLGATCLFLALAMPFLNLLLEVESTLAVVAFDFLEFPFTAGGVTPQGVKALRGGGTRLGGCPGGGCSRLLCWHRPAPGGTRPGAGQPIEELRRPISLPVTASRALSGLEGAQRRMEARLGARLWLAAALLLAYCTESAVATLHSPFPSVADVGHEEAADGGAEDRHDPASCVLCQVISQFRAYGPLPPSLCAPLTEEATQLVDDVPLAPRPRVCLRGPTSRAPPHSPIA
jgi:hypothetical protein